MSPSSRLRQVPCLGHVTGFGQAPRDPGREA
jgi:hypothetical protein